MKRAGLLVAVLVCCGGFVVAATPDSDEELRRSLFAGANQALQAANDARASLLAPTSYTEGARYYRDAEATLESGGGIESIRRDLTRAQEAFRKAAEHCVVAAPAFETVLEAREDAMSAEAATYAPGDWETAEKTFNDAAVRLERGRLTSAQRTGEEAQTQYREAELTAIKANYLDETVALLEQADDLRAERYAPQSFATAQKLLEEAEASLNADRYDTDRPRSLASEAKHNALHAIYVSRLERQMRADETSLEQILFGWEESLRGLANMVDTPIYFDDGESSAVTAIGGRIEELKNQNQQLGDDLRDRDAQLLAMGADVANLQRIKEVADRQERQREQVQAVENLFEPSQAVVLRQGDSIIIRMIGLNFDSGQAVLKPEHYRLLGILESAINRFPESSIVIEGHTDSFGSDALNQELSQQRADAVQDYLLRNSPISPGSITALGYGETRPVANNETAEGRRSNRRIDVVIYPRW